MLDKTVLPARLICVMLTVLVVAFSIRADVGHDHDGQEPVAQNAEIIQKTCPVIVGNKIDPEIFTTYEGKKVYFCCTTCRAAFEKEPEKYLAALPQFNSAAKSEDTSSESQHRHGGFSLGTLIEPAGITTFSLLLVTACAGFFMSKNRKLLFKWHRRLAITTLIVAICHVLLVMLFH